MNRAVSPLMRSEGYRRSGQAFEKHRNGCEAYVGFQKSVHNTKLSLSFTINVSVVNRVAAEEQRRAWFAATAVWGPDITVIPQAAQWGGRIGEFMGRGDYW